MGMLALLVGAAAATAAEKAPGQSCPASQNEDKARPDADVVQSVPEAAGAQGVVLLQTGVNTTAVTNETQANNITAHSQVSANGLVQMGSQVSAQIKGTVKATAGRRRTRR